MYAFQYHRPETVSAARELYQIKDDALFVAGGHTLLPSMKQRLSSPGDLIDISGINELYGIKPGSGNIVIGAMTPHADVAGSAEVSERIAGLAELAGSIGDLQVRNRGTMGGSIANADPAADYPAAVVGLGATVYTDSRAIPGDEYFTGMFETALEEGELITRVEFPVPDQSVYVKFANPASRYAIVGVFMSVTKGHVRVGVTGAAACAYRLTESEQLLTENLSVDALGNSHVDASGLNADLHASAEYRAHLLMVMVKRAVARLTA